MSRQRLVALLGAVALACGILGMLWLHGMPPRDNHGSPQSRAALVTRDGSATLADIEPSPKGALERTQVQLPATGSAQVSGVVVVDGRPPGTAIEIVLRHGSGKGFLRTLSDAEGNFAFLNVQSGEVKLCPHPDFRIESSTEPGPSCLYVASPSADVRLNLETRPLLMGRVEVDATAGDQAHAVTVAWQDAGQPRERQTAVRRDGSFRFYFEESLPERVSLRQGAFGSRVGEAQD